MTRTSEPACERARSLVLSFDVFGETALWVPGRELGTSEWHSIPQDRVDLFAHATEDEQWIHVDPTRAAEGPFGGPVAHGYLVLAMLPAMTSEILRFVGVRTRVNYGLDRVRFPAPVPTGSRVRDHVSLGAVEDHAAGARRVVLEHRVELDGGDRPAVAATTVTLCLA